MKGYSAFPKAPALLDPTPLDCLMSYPGYSMRRILLLSRNTVGVFYGHGLLGYLYQCIKSLKSLKLYIYIYNFTKSNLSIYLSKWIVRLCTLTFVQPISYFNWPVSWGCRIHWLHFCRGVRPPLTSVLDMILNNLMVRLQKRWSFGECGVPLHCHRSQVHSGPEW